MVDLKAYPELTVSELQAALDFATDQVRANLPDFTYACQSDASKDLFYFQDDNVEWTTGFWPGEIWLSYERTGDPTFMYAGLILVQSFLDRIEEKIEVEHHDMGFLYSPSCVSAYMLTGDEYARSAALQAADQLMGRWQEKGQFIQAWGPNNSPEHHRLIIDCLLNLGLLYWASEESGDGRYADIAHRHIETTIKYAIREDGSAYHTFYFDPETGEPVKGVTHQGYKDDSSWARGQAWAVYGTAISYRYTGIEQYKEVFRKTLDYYLEKLPKNLVPYWDLIFSDGSDEPWDSSASAIVICGLLEMADLVDEDERKEYRTLASKLMKALIDHCAVKDPEESNGLLKHGTYAKQSPYNPIKKNNGVDECVSFGDYFYFEALTRLNGNWDPYW